MINFTGFSEEYHSIRPSPPEDIYQTLVQLSKNKADLVVDLGCGTGISTIPWIRYAAKIIGIDPSEDMLKVAEIQSSHSNITYQKGYGNNTDIGDGQVDIVSCATSVHWMEPKTSIAEIHRILRKGGVFAAFGPQVPFLPLEHWELAVAFNKFLSFVKQIQDEQPEKTKIEVWKWAKILQHVQTCGSFSYTDELCFNKCIQWNAEEYCNWVKTFSYVHPLISSANTEVINAFDRFENKAKELIGDHKRSILVSYRMIVGIV